jgi:hypothetical protein
MMSKADFGVFKSPAEEEPAAPPKRSKLQWVAICAALIIVVFGLGERTGAALQDPASQVVTARIKLDCHTDGSIVLDMGGMYTDGDHVLSALRRAAIMICSRHGT